MLLRHLFPSPVWVTPVHPCTSVSFSVTSRLTCIPMPLSCSCLRYNRKLDVESARLASPLAVATWRWTGMPARRDALIVSLRAPTQPFLSCRTSTGGWSQGGAWHWGSWLVLLGPRQTRPQAMGSCHALTTCSCPGVLWQTNKRNSSPSSHWPWAWQGEDLGGSQGGDSPRFCSPQREAVTPGWRVAPVLCCWHNCVK